MFQPLNGFLFQSPVLPVEYQPASCNEIDADELTSIARKHPVASNPRVGASGAEA